MLLELVFSWRFGWGGDDRELCGYLKVLWMCGIGLVNDEKRWE